VAVACDVRAMVIYKDLGDIPEAMTLAGGASAPLRAYIDPLFVAPYGTPAGVVQECQELLREHHFGPQSVCDLQFLAVGDHSDNPHTHLVVMIAWLLCITVTSAAALGLGLPLASTLFKRRVDHAYLQARRATGQYQRVLSLL